MRYLILFIDRKTNKLLPTYYKFANKKAQLKALPSFKKTYPVTKYKYVISVQLICFMKNKKTNT